MLIKDYTPINIILCFTIEAEVGCGVQIMCFCHYPYQFESCLPIVFTNPLHYNYAVV